MSFTFTNKVRLPWRGTPSGYILGVTPTDYVNFTDFVYGTDGNIIFMGPISAPSSTETFSFQLKSASSSLVLANVSAVIGSDPVHPDIPVLVHEDIVDFFDIEITEEPPYNTGNYYMRVRFFPAGFFTTIFLTQCQAGLPTQSWQNVNDSFDSTYPGTYQLVDTSGGGSTVVETFDIRFLVTTNVAANPPRFDPKRFEGTAITGKHKALPAPGASSLYPAGWWPSSLTTNLYMCQGTYVEPFPAPTYAYDATKMVHSASASSSGITGVASDGTIATFNFPWNGVDDNTGDLTGATFMPTVGADTVVDVDGGGPTGSLQFFPTLTNYPEFWPGISATVCTRCGSMDGTSKIQQAIDLLSSPFDLNLSTLLSYNNIYSQDIPTSMGYGWSSVQNVRVFVDGSGNLLYQDENQNLLRWNWTGSVFQKYTQDNYVLASHDTTNHWYVLTFQDQSQRIFSDSTFRLLKDLDRNGNSLTYNMDAYGRLSTIVDSTSAARTITYSYATTSDLQPQSISTGGRTIGLTYNALNQLHTVTTPAGDVTTYTYDPVSGSLATIIDPTGTTAVAYTYDFIGRVLTETSYTNQTKTTYQYSYDAITGQPAAGNSMTMTDLTLNSPDRVVVEYTDAYGNLVRSRELVDHTTGIYNETVMTYADTHNPYLVTQIQDPNLNTTNVTYNLNGNPSSVLDCQNNLTQWVYAEDLTSPPDTNPKHQNLLVRLIRPTVTVNGVPTNYTPELWGYDSNGNLNQYTDALGHSTTYSPNSDGTLGSVTDANGKTTSFGYSATTKNLTTITYPKETGDPSGPSQRLTTLAYDAYDNVMTVTDALSHAVSVVSDADNRTYQVTDPLLNMTQMNYVNGLLSSIQQPDNDGSSGHARNTTYGFDSANRVNAVSRDVAISTPQQRVGYTYNGFSDLIRLTRKQTTAGSDHNNSYSYDALGRPISSSDPLSRTTTVEYAPYCLQNKVTTARGVHRLSSYDSLCRLTQVGTQTELREFSYDELSRLVEDVNGGRYAWNDGASRVGAKYQSSVSKNGRTYQYDALDRVTQITFSDGTYITYTWDPVGNLLSQRDVWGQVTNYTYYDDNRLNTVSFTYSGTTYTFTYTYDLAGRPATITFPAGTSIVLSFTDGSGNPGWDANGRLTSMRYLKSGSNIQSFAYTYDHSGNRTGQVDTSSAGTVTWVYGYDWLDRLTTVTKNGTLTATYGYDQSDNRATLDQGSLHYVYNYDAADQITSTVLGGSTFESFVHDSDGNMTSRTLASTSAVTSYEWNDFNNLIGFALNGTTQEKDFYTAGGVRRIRDDGSQYVTSGAFSLADKRPTVGQVSYFQGHQILGLQEGGAVSFFLTDALGSVRQVVNTSGVGVASFATDEYGVPTASSGSAELLAHTYVGGLGVRNETGTPSGTGPVSSRGLYYMNQRWYDPALGRFISSDPIGFVGGLNRYVYTANNPTNAADPSGLAWYINGDVSHPYNTPQEFYQALLDPGLKIDRLDFDSHGFRTFSSFESEDSGKIWSAGGLWASDGANPELQLVDGKLNPFKGFQNLLRKRLRPGAHINFWSCHAGENDARGVARLFSQTYPDAIVTGSPLFISGNFKGIPEVRPWTSPNQEGGPWSKRFNQFVGGVLKIEGNAIPYGVKPW